MHAHTDMGFQTMPYGKLCDLFNRAKPYLFMVALRFGSAGMYITTMAAFNRGMSRYVLIVYRNAVAALFLAPFALVFDRKTRPKMTISIFLKIMLMAFLETVLDQNLSFLGMQFTSATYMSAIMNAVPAVTFIIAIILRMERVKMNELSSKAKVIGTLVTFTGTLVMTFYKGPIINLLWSSSHKTIHHGSSVGSSELHWIVGTLLIIIAACAWAFFYILQSVTIKEYKADLSLSSLICLAGTLQNAAIALVVIRKPRAWAVGWDSRLLASLYSGVVSSGVTYYVQGLVMKTRGPVFATAFNPLSMIIVATLGAPFLAEKLHLGSVIGGFIIAIGLYSVVWGKSKDYTGPTPSTEEKGEAHELPITAANATN